MVTREKILEVIRSSVSKVLFDLDPQLVTEEKSLAELGANSVDRVEVVMYAMEELNLKLPRVELHGVQNLRGLVDLFYKHLNRT